MSVVSNPPHSLTIHPAYIYFEIVTAVAGLSVATAPDFGHYLTLFLPIAARNDLGAGIAICLAAACAATLFVTVAVLVVNREYAFETNSLTLLTLS